MVTRVADEPLLIKKMATAQSCSRALWRTQLYMEQVGIWPKEGKHILAQYDEESIIVYQAYSPPIASYAIEHQKYYFVIA